MENGDLPVGGYTTFLKSPSIIAEFESLSVW